MNSRKKDFHNSLLLSKMSLTSISNSNNINLANKEENVNLLNRISQFSSSNSTLPHSIDFNSNLKNMTTIQLKPENSYIIKALNRNSTILVDSSNKQKIRTRSSFFVNKKSVKKSSTKDLKKKILNINLNNAYNSSKQTSPSRKQSKACSNQSSPRKSRALSAKESEQEKEKEKSIGVR